MPSLSRTLAILEFEFHAKPGIERTQVARIGVSVHGGRTNSARLAKVSVPDTEPALLELIHPQLRALVCNVEQISDQAQMCPFRNADGIVEVPIDAAKVRRAAQRATSRSAVGGVIRAIRNFTSVLVRRVGIQIVDRDTRLEVYGSAHGQALDVISAERITHEAIRQVMNIRVQHAGHELLAQQVEVPPCEVKE